MEFFLWLGVTIAVIVSLKARTAARETDERVTEIESRFQAVRNRLAELDLLLQKLDPSSSSSKQTTEPRREASDTAASAPSTSPAMQTFRPATSPPPQSPLAPPLGAALKPQQPSAPAPQRVAPPASGPLPLVTSPTQKAPEPQSAPPPPPPPPPPARPTPPPPRQAFDWEGLIGVKLFSWIAGIALVLAAILFLRYSLERGWIGPPIRAAIGLLTGAALLVVCELKIARDYKATANAMHGAGIAILFATLFATYALWHLFPAALVFGLMLAVTAVAVLLSIRRDSIFIALLGLVGGFATPAMLSSGENQPIGLFSYLLLLNVGLAWVAHRKRWPALTWSSLVLTVLYQWLWLGKFLTTPQLPLAMGIFLLFAAVSSAPLWLRRKKELERQNEFDASARIAAMLPLMFALYTAAVPAYGAHIHLLFGYLLAIDIGLAVIAFTRGPRLLHLVGGAATLLVMLIWIAGPNALHAWPVELAWIVCFAAFYLAAEPLVEQFGVVAPTTPARLVAPLLLFVFPVITARESATSSPFLLFAVLFVLLAVISASAILRREGITYYVGAFLAVAAEAVWSVKYLDHAHLLSALAMYGIFSLLFLGVPVLARRMRKPLEPAIGTAVLLYATIGLLFFLATGTVAASALWGIALLLLVLNLGMFASTSMPSHPLLSIFAVVLSWIVLAVWWVSSIGPGNIVPALFVVCAFAVLVTAAGIWQRRAGQEENGEEPIPGGLIPLAMVGHLFLMFVASQTALSFPPWPMLAVLAVLDLAALIAALYLQTAMLFTLSMCASQFVVMIWAGAARRSIWPITGLASVLVLAAGALAGWRLAVRRFRAAAPSANGSANGFAGSATACLFLGLMATMIIGGVTDAPLFASLLASQGFLVLAILFVEGTTREDGPALVAVAMSAIATSLAVARLGTPHETLWFALVPYALFTLYPVVLGRRVGKSIAPHLVAVIASAPFFFFARHALLDTMMSRYIGALPVAQAVVLLLVLSRLLKMERPSERTLARLALVAGASLAFITLAVPLQLEKQWITVAWALEGAALVWLFRKIPHRGLLLWAAALLSTVLVRLTLNPAVLSYHARSSVRIWNWYFYTYAIAAFSLFAAARLLPEKERREWPKARPVTAAAGALLLFFLLNIEVADFYSSGPAITFNFFSSSLAQDLTYTMAWAVFAIGLLINGIMTRQRAGRVAAILLLLVTIFKCFLHDLGRLEGLYRIGSLLGLAASLVAVGILLQRFVIRNVAVPPAQGEAIP